MEWGELRAAMHLCEELGHCGCGVGAFVWQTTQMVFSVPREALCSFSKHSMFLERARHKIRSRETPHNRP